MTISVAMQVLELGDQASNAKSIKIAYKRLIRIWHPDTYVGHLSISEVTAKAQSINAAYALLTSLDPPARTRKPAPAPNRDGSEGSCYWTTDSGKSLRVPFTPNPRWTSGRRRYRDGEVTHGFPPKHLKEFFFYSTSIVSAAYDELNQRLFLKFSESELYQYSDVPEDVVRALLAAASHGSYARRYICYSFRYERIPWPS